MITIRDNRGYNRFEFDDLDENIVSLVRELNKFPDIWTYSGCGGHNNPSVCQTKKDEFYINFYVAVTSRGAMYKNGVKSLNLILNLINNLNNSNITVTTWGDPNYPIYEIRGKNNFRPDYLAYRLREVRLQNFTTHTSRSSSQRRSK